MKTQDIVVRDDLKSYLPPLTPSERTHLEDLIVTFGCRDPLVLWKGKRVLIDGHHRYEICERRGFPFKTVELDFADDEAVFRWMENHMEGRRNRTRSARRYYLGARYLREKQRRGAPDGNCNRKQIRHGDGIETAERIATEENVSARTVERAADFARMVDELDAHVGNGIKWDILTEQILFTKRLFTRLTETDEQTAGNAVLAARNEASSEEKPLSSSAILKQLPPEEETDSSTGDSEEVNINAVLGPFFTKLRDLADKANTYELEDMVVRLKSYVVEFEGRLTRRKQ